MMKKDKIGVIVKKYRVTKKVNLKSRGLMASFRRSKDQWQNILNS